MLGFGGFSSLYPRNLAQIGSLSANNGTYLAFGTSNSYAAGVTNQAMTIDPSGNVGIGTTTPGRTLHLAAAEPYIHFDGTHVDGDYLIGTGDGNLYFTDASTALPSMTINDANVGIGTAAPGGKLHVYGLNNSAGDLWTVVGTGNTPNITIQNASATDNTNAALFFKNDSVYVGGIGMRFTNHSSDAAQMRFSTCTGGNTRERMILDESGHLLPAANGTYNLGGSGNYWASCYFENTAINGTLYVGGVLTAASNVDVAQSKYLRVGGSTSTAPFSARQVSGSSMVHLMELNTGTSVQAYSFGLDTVGNYIDFVIQSEYGAGSWGERFRITKQYGCVGIGTTAPDSKLHVYGGKIHVKVTSGTGSGAHIQGYSDASTPKLLTLGTHSYGDGTLGMTTISGHGYLETYGAFDLHLRPNQSTGMVIKNGGKVGIGTTAPVDKLHLASGGKFRNGRGVEFSNEMSLANNQDYTFTIAGMAYGTAEFHCGFYGGGAWLNFHVTLGGHMSSGSKIYGATILANESGGNVTVTATENNGNYVVGIGQTSGGTCYGSYWFKSSTYTDGAGVASVTWATA